MTPVRLEPAAPRSRVKHSTNEPLHLKFYCISKIDALKLPVFNSDSSYSIGGTLYAELFYVAVVIY